MKHLEIPKSMQEDPFREYDFVQKVISETQFEADERKSVAKKWWMPYHIGRETWHTYDVRKCARAPLPCPALYLTPRLPSPFFPHVRADQERMVLEQQEVHAARAQVKNPL